MTRSWLEFFFYMFFFFFCVMTCNAFVFFVCTGYGMDGTVMGYLMEHIGINATFSWALILYFDVAACVKCVIQADTIETSSVYLGIL